MASWIRLILFLGSRPSSVFSQARTRWKTASASPCSTHAVEREHQQLGHPLPLGVLTGELLQCADDRGFPADAEPRLVEVLQRAGRRPASRFAWAMQVSPPATSASA